MEHLGPTTVVAPAAGPIAWDFSTGLTFEVFVRPDSVTGASTLVALQDGGPDRDPAPGAHTLSARLQIIDGEFFFDWWTAGGEHRRAHGGEAKVGEWTHVAGVVDPMRGATWIYAQGLKVAAANTPGMVRPTTGTITLGNELGEDQQFYGTADNLRVWTLPLDGEQIRRAWSTPVGDAGELDYILFGVFPEMTPLPTPTPSPQPSPRPPSIFVTLMIVDGGTSFTQTWTDMQTAGVELQSFGLMMWLDAKGLRLRWEERRNDE